MATSHTSPTDHWKSANELKNYGFQFLAWCQLFIQFTYDCASPFAILDTDNGLTHFRPGEPLLGTAALYGGVDERRSLHTQGRILVVL